jgi:hypothetical protein
MVPIVKTQQAAIPNTRIAKPPQKSFPESASSLAELEKHRRSGKRIRQLK